MLVGTWLVASWPGRALLVLVVALAARKLWKRLPARRAREKVRVLPDALEAERQRFLALPFSGKINASLDRSATPGGIGMSGGGGTLWCLRKCRRSR